MPAFPTPSDREVDPNATGTTTWASGGTIAASTSSSSRRGLGPSLMVQGATRTEPLSAVDHVLTVEVTTQARSDLLDHFFAKNFAVEFA